MSKHDTEILAAPENVCSFIDAKAKARYSVGSEIPFCVANLDDLYEKLLQWKALLPRVKPFYAVKCNNSPAVLRTLSALDTGFDCASKMEIEAVMSFGVKPERIIYAHTTKPLSHISYARARGVDMMTFDSEGELRKISVSHPKAKLVLRIAVDDSKSHAKLNTKFGAKLQNVSDLLKRAQELRLNVVGVSFHVGCECEDTRMYHKAIADARQVFNEAKLLGFRMNLLDIGGGFSGSEDFSIPFQQVSNSINEALDEHFPADSKVQIIAEPGRYFVESAFTLAANIFAKRVVWCDPCQCKDEDKCNGKIMMYYLSEGVFGTLNAQVYYYTTWKVTPLVKRPMDSNAPKFKSILWGPTCDSVDKINTFWMPELDIGDWLLVHDVGAYSVPLASEFNGFEKAQIYPVVTAQTWNILSKL